MTTLVAISSTTLHSRARERSRSPCSRPKWSLLRISIIQYNRVLVAFSGIPECKYGTASFRKGRVGAKR